MNYYDKIDDLGEELNECKYCGAPTLESYCSTECKHADNFN